MTSGKISQLAPDSNAVIMQTFATPVARITWPHADQLNNEIADVVLTKLDPLGNQLTYKTETASDLVAWGHPAVTALTNWVLRAAQQFIETIAGKTLDQAFADALTRTYGQVAAGGDHTVAVKVGRSWASVYRKGDHHEPHYHANTALTAIYYVEAPSTCELDLLDPRPNIDYFDPGITLAGESHRIRLRCVPGHLVLFPGWLKHAVPQFEQDGVRISLSWNLGYGKK